MEELVVGIAALVVAIAGAFLELLVHLLAIVMGSSFQAKHEKGVKRFFYAICAVTALHLFLGLTLPFVSGFEEFILSPLFNRWMMLGSVIILIIAYASALAVDLSDKTAKSTAPVDGDNDDPNQKAPRKTPVLLIYFIAGVVVLGFMAIASSDHKRTTLREEICLSVTAKISPTWKDRGARAMELAEKYLHRDIEGKLPCRNIDKP